MNTDAHLLLISDTLELLVPLKPEEPHAALFEAARYSLLSGGKRLRPLIVLSIAETYNVNLLEKALHPACALEMVHTYSLIHDDLPCMDDDDLRRGKPTLHKVYKEGHAVLTGDFLLTYAFEVLTQAPHLSPHQKLELIQILSKAAGSEGMIGGQAVDIAWEEKCKDEKMLEFVHMHKTAALMEAAFLFGGIVAEAPLADKQQLSSAGKHLGLAFQIIDDLLDANQAKDSPSILASCSASQARERAKDHYSAALEALSSLSEPAPKLIFLAKALVNRVH